MFYFLWKMVSLPLCQASEEEKSFKARIGKSQGGHSPKDSMRWGGGCTFKGRGPVVSMTLTFADLYNPHDDDQGQGQELPSCENILNPGGPSHTGAVDPCEQH